MREIKFRAWDTRLKEWLGADEWWIKPDGSVQTRYWSDAKPGLVEPLVEVGHFILVQYIGLKDKNGVEIYEGDIITGWQGNNEPAVVELEPAGSFWYWNGEYGGENGFEIIGNIYENGDLLK